MLVARVAAGDDSSECAKSGGSRRSAPRAREDRRIRSEPIVVFVQQAFDNPPGRLFGDSLEVRNPTDDLLRTEDRLALRTHPRHLISMSSTCYDTISNLCKPGTACAPVRGSKVTVSRKAIMVRIPVVLLKAVERITEVEGWANRQAFIEQAVREKVERWYRDHPLEAAPRRN